MKRSSWRRLKEWSDLPLPTLHVSPLWIWRAQWRGADPLWAVFRNRTGIRKDGYHYRWGVRVWGVEFGNRG